MGAETTYNEGRDEPMMFADEIDMREKLWETGAFFDPELPSRVDQLPKQDARAERHVANIEGEGAEVEFTIELPDKIEDPVPGIFLPGYGGIKPAYYNLRREYAERGKAAISYKVPRAQAGMTGLAPRHSMHPERLQTQAVRTIMQKVGDMYGFEQFDLSGHSNGGYIATKAGWRWPESIRSIIFVAPAGFEPHSVFTLAGRIPRFVSRELIPAIKAGKIDIDLPYWKIGMHGLEYIARNPIRTLSEGISVGQCDNRDTAAFLRSLGIRTAIVGFPADELIHTYAMAKHSSGLVDEFIVFPDKKAGHLGPQTHPRELAHMQLRLLDHWFDKEQTTRDIHLPAAGN